MTIRYNLEPFDGQLFERLSPVLREHFDEIEADEHLAYDPQYAAYVEAARQGRLLTLLARDGDEIAGYYLGFLGQGLHSRATRMLQSDSFYVRPQYRCSTIALDLMRAVEAAARSRAAQLLIAMVKLDARGHDEVAPLLRAVGYRPIEQAHAKWLE